jgi:hypothetical protein
MIPRNIHFVWVGGGMPDWAAENVQRFADLNPGYEVRVHSDLAEIDTRLRHHLDSDLSPVQQADLLRYSVLLNEGGWYFDIDFLPLRPIDDIVSAYRLDGRSVFVSRQRGHRHVRWNISNAVLACGAGAPGMNAIVEHVSAATPQSRCAFGPPVVSGVVDRSRRLFTVAEAGWFFPLCIDETERVAPHVLDGDMRGVMSDRTAGQIPFAAHLWAGALDLVPVYSTDPDKRPVAAVLESREGHWLDSVAEGLSVLGYRVVRVGGSDSLRGIYPAPEVVATWNGKRDTGLAEAAESIGATMIYNEHGWFDRGEYTQLDTCGWTHTASWAASVAAAATDRGRDRLAQFYPAGPSPQKHNADGYILVLGQVDGDMQMLESEIQGHIPLQYEIHKALKAIGQSDHKIFFRPHPQMVSVNPHPGDVHFPRLSGASERQAYIETKHGVGLSDALRGAKFCIAINSSALNEALAAGVPCMAFGPHLGIIAGVVKGTRLATLQQDLQSMIAGEWRPSYQAVCSYLAHLADHQFSRNEIAQGWPLLDVLRGAGVSPPATLEVSHV